MQMFKTFDHSITRVKSSAGTSTGKQNAEEIIKGRVQLLCY